MKNKVISYNRFSCSDISNSNFIFASYNFIENYQLRKSGMVKVREFSKNHKRIILSMRKTNIEGKVGKLNFLCVQKERNSLSNLWISVLSKSEL